MQFTLTSCYFVVRGFHCLGHHNFQAKIKFFYDIRGGNNALLKYLYLIYTRALIFSDIAFVEVLRESILIEKRSPLLLL